MKKWIKIIVAVCLVLAISLTALVLHQPAPGKYTLNRDLYNRLSEQPGYVKLESVSPLFLDVLVANEDKRFYSHKGFDLIRISGAALGNIKAGKLQTGGSSITQQLAKNLFYSYEQTFTRKLLELGTAIRLEYYFSKAQILEMYINVIYYGSDAYGISEASRTYYDKPPDQLTLEESAMLVGLLPAPSVYNPNNDVALAERRQREALNTYYQITTRQ